MRSTIGEKHRKVNIYTIGKALESSRELLVYFVYVCRLNLGFELDASSLFDIINQLKRKGKRKRRKFTWNVVYVDRYTIFPHKVIL